MAAISTIALVTGLALSAAGTAISFTGAQKQAEAQKHGIEAQQRAEATRQRAMQLDAARQRREIIRQSVLNRSQAQNTATEQGAQFGSGLGGALSQVSGQSGYNLQGVNQAETLGGYQFQAHQEQLQANKEGAAAGTQAAVGSGLSSLGGALTKNLGSINRLSEYAFG